jgi:hypothetical protein
MSKHEPHNVPPPGPCQCHPRVGKTRPEEGCIPTSILKDVARKLSIHHNEKGLRAKLEEHFHVKPEHEYTFLLKLPLSLSEKHKIANEYLRPRARSGWKKDPDMWLDSTNIADVMNQYEEAYPKFEFMGPFPIDFAAKNPYQKGGTARCLMNEVCEFRIQKAMESGTESVGIVYNLDPHFKGGSHWVASFIDIKNHRCLYFDSYGIKPPAQIARFMQWLTTQDSKMELIYNSKRIQYKNTECGMYSMYFIIRMLMADEFVKFARASPKDDGMMAIRKCLYSW